MMDLLETFDPYAFVEPKTASDVIALLDECISEMEHVSLLVAEIFARREGRDI